ncbi:MAG: hypothetical protein ABIO70_01705 [Pseudomonadota bacterium]
MSLRYQVVIPDEPCCDPVVEIQRRDPEAEALKGGDLERWEAAWSWALPGLGEPFGRDARRLRLRLYAVPWFYVEGEEESHLLLARIGGERAAARLAGSPRPIDLAHLQHDLDRAILGASGAPSPTPVSPADCPLFAAARPGPVPIHPRWAHHSARFGEQLRAAGWRYGDAAELAELCGRPRPASLAPAGHKAFLQWLDAESERAATWRRRREFLLDEVVAQALCSVSLVAGPGGEALVVETFQPSASARERESLERLLPHHWQAAHVGPITCVAELPDVAPGEERAAFRERLWSALVPGLVGHARTGVIRRTFRGPLKPLQACFNRALHPVTPGARSLTVRIAPDTGGDVLDLWDDAARACQALGIGLARAEPLALAVLQEVAETWAHPWKRRHLRAHFATTLRLRLYNELACLPRKVNLRLFGRLVQHGFVQRYQQAGQLAVRPSRGWLLDQLRSVAKASISALFGASGRWHGVPLEEEKACVDELVRRLGARWWDQPPVVSERAIEDTWEALRRSPLIRAWRTRIERALPGTELASRNEEALERLRAAWEESWPGLGHGFVADFLAAVRVALHRRLWPRRVPPSGRAWDARYQPATRAVLAHMADDLARDFQSWIGPAMAAQMTPDLVESWLGEDVIDEACSRGGHAHRVSGGIMDAHRARFWPFPVELYLARLGRGEGAAPAAGACALTDDKAFLEAANAWCLEDVLPPDLLADPARPLQAYTAVLHEPGSPLAPILLAHAADDALLKNTLDWTTPADIAGEIEPFGGEPGSSPTLFEVQSGDARAHDIATVAGPTHPPHEAAIVAITRGRRELVEGVKRGKEPFSLSLFNDPGVTWGDTLRVRRPSLREHVESLLGDDETIARISEGGRLELGRLLGRTRVRPAPGRLAPLHPNQGSDDASPADDGGPDATALVLQHLCAALGADTTPGVHP